jgi:hypothetical protein
MSDEPRASKEVPFTLVPWDIGVRGATYADGSLRSFPRSTLVSEMKKLEVFRTRHQRIIDKFSEGSLGLRTR